MTEPQTARLSRVVESTEGSPQPGALVVEVQFNPATLKLARQGTQAKAASTTKNQDVQYASTQPATLTLDLEFDTAEDFDNGVPVDVRKRTDPLREFLDPPKGKPADAPPRLHFRWGVFTFLGIVTQLSEEFDYFAADGTPLRAKIGITIQGQDPKLEAAQSGTGARTDPNAKPSGSAVPPAGSPPRGSAPGHSGTASPIEEVAALAGESVQQLAARIGGNPAAWRSLMNDLPSPLGLVAGTSVAVGPELRGTATIGDTSGFRAGEAVAQALPGVLGVGASGQGPVRGLGAGLVIAAAGGIDAATRRVVAAEQAGAVAAARAGFDVPIAGRTPAAEPDPRASTFGRSVPLRVRAHPSTLVNDAAGGRRAVGARARPAEVPASSGGPVPPWEQLPPGDPGDAAVTAVPAPSGRAQEVGAGDRPHPGAALRRRATRRERPRRRPSRAAVDGGGAMVRPARPCGMAGPPHLRSRLR